MGPLSIMKSAVFFFGTAAFCAGITPHLCFAASPTQAEIVKLEEKINRQNTLLANQAAQLSNQLNQVQQQRAILANEQQEILTMVNSNKTAAKNQQKNGYVSTNTQVQTPAPSQSNNSSAATPTPQSVSPPTENPQEVAASQQQAATQNENEKTNLVLQTNSSLLQAGGVLTPKGTLVIQPELSYSYYNSNQVNVNGFTIVPGITFGNININTNQEHLVTQQITLRLGLTNRSEVYVRIPFLTGYDTTVTSPILAGQTVAPLVVSSHAFNLGDISLGGSYQINQGSVSIPTFVANLNFKTITGTSPFSVPIFTTNELNGTYLAGIDKRLPTGTGFYQLQPSLTILYPTSPVILFGNLQYIYNIPNTVSVQSISGGASIRTKLQPGNGVGISFGMGFSLNDNTSFSIGYQEDQYFNESQNGTSIKGTAYDEGAFDFGLGYSVSKKVNINVGVGIGVGPNAPAAQIVIRIPVSMNIF